MPRGQQADPFGQGGAYRRSTWTGGSGVVGDMQAMSGGRAARGDAELAEDVGCMHASGLGRDEQLGRDLAVAAPGRNQPLRLQLTRGKPEQRGPGGSSGSVPDSGQGMGVIHEGGRVPQESKDLPAARLGDRPIRTIPSSPHPWHIEGLRGGANTARGAGPR